jgi:hypothetical protein
MQQQDRTAKKCAQNMLSSLARTFSRFSEQPSEAFPDVAGTLQIHPNPWNLLDSWDLL